MDGSQAEADISRTLSYETPLDPADRVLYHGRLVPAGAIPELESLLAHALHDEPVTTGSAAAAAQASAAFEGPSH